ncbi:hypothetical protein [Lacrimispora sp. JR3]|uniref:hypothetical protein n=1 Tax=Lacrimispora sinapis TaxID=3111456 RepID=UPI003748ADC8
MTVGNVIYRLSYGAADYISISILPVSGSVLIDLKRSSQYDGTIDASTLNNYTLSSIQSLDSIVYNSSREMHRVWLRQQDPDTSLWSLYEIDTFSSASGARTTVWVYLIESDVTLP